MKSLFLLPLLFLISCGNSELKRKTIKPGFIYKPGIYRILDSKQKNRNIIVKEFTDGSLIFAISDSKNKILFQQNLTQNFNKYHYWSLYVDNEINIWYYDSDFGSSYAVLFNNKTNIYEVRDFCATKLILPKDFKKEIETKNIENCKSLIISPTHK